MKQSFFGALCLAVIPCIAFPADLHPVQVSSIPEWKAVFGQIEARDQVAARSRLGGTITELTVSEGDTVTSGQQIGLVEDEKLLFQIQTFNGRIEAQTAQLDNARAELKRGEELFQRGVMSSQQVDLLRTNVNVLENQIAATRAEKQVMEQRSLEGAVLAPVDGVVLRVPLTAGSVVLPGEEVARIGGGGLFLRLSVPERHAALLGDGDEIRIEWDGRSFAGRIAKLYPEIQNGRVTADVEVADLQSRFVNARVLVRLPVGEKPGILVPEAAVASRRGLDFVRLQLDGAETVERTVVTGRRLERDGEPMIEVLSGLSQGNVVVTGHE
ncbi:efflux RND transporter periplasmic adaptor subunit [Ruegeria sediminis]|uniref:Efflux RND transporter periplasmic adaptor subunit n=1 Tax=Ruegeria sediminis TaxID=2583820 RepID=A0ABY2X253_9RHOB|nr:efflux RND transporter periplasmic adaptor subunit [Ruegeria sediminis]TMV08923.1 efflux RND transporter periplasmic adaptor subunit [Ruegeria sediminis]